MKQAGSYDFLHIGAVRWGLDIASAAAAEVERRGVRPYPRIVHFVDALPKTVSGKIQRNELRRLTAASHQPSVHKETP